MNDLIIAYYLMGVVEVVRPVFGAFSIIGIVFTPVINISFREEFRDKVAKALSVGLILICVLMGIIALLTPSPNAIKAYIALKVTSNGYELISELPEAHKFRQVVNQWLDEQIDTPTTKGDPQ